VQGRSTSFGGRVQESAFVADDGSHYRGEFDVDDWLLESLDTERVDEDGE